MSVRVKLKNLTTDILQMGFNHVVPLIQVTYYPRKSKNGFQVGYHALPIKRDMVEFSLINATFCLENSNV